MSASKITSSKNNTSIISNDPSAGARKMLIDVLLDAYRKGETVFQFTTLRAERIANALMLKYRSRGVLSVRAERPHCPACTKLFNIPGIPDMGGPLVADITMLLEAAVERGAA